MQKKRQSQHSKSKASAVAAYYLVDIQRQTKSWVDIEYNSHIYLKGSLMISVFLKLLLQYKFASRHSKHSNGC